MDEHDENPYIEKSIKLYPNVWVGVVRGRLRKDGKRNTMWTVPCRTEEKADKAAKADLEITINGERRKA